MSSENKHILIGHVGRDPEIRHTQTGDVVANFSLATSERWTDKAGVKQERTEWHQVVVFGKLAEIAEKYITKGKQLYLWGPSQTEEWTDKAGVKRTSVKIVAKSIVLLGKKEEASNGGDDEVPF
jgi:single-strand DNA-binding protein